MAKICKTPLLLLITLSLASNITINNPPRHSGAKTKKILRHRTPPISLSNEDLNAIDSTGATAKQPKSTTRADYDKAIFNWTRTFAEVLQITGERHYKIIDPEESMIKAIDSFLINMDPHSGFLGPKTYAKILEATAGEFYGVGIIIDNTRKSTDRFLVVVEPIAGGPAETAGLRAGDKIVDINEKPIEGMSTDEATALLKGELNTLVTIKIMREGYPDMLSFTIKRGVVTEQSSMAFYIKEHNIYYISLHQFSENSIQQVKKLLQKETTVPYKGLILDLRNNSGGLLTSAIDIAGLFLEKGALVTTTKGRSGKLLEEYRTTNDPIAKTHIPIFILINNYTASAAEILSGALKVYSEKACQKAREKNTEQKSLMVFLLGTKTFGKGSVQDVIALSNNCALKITSALYYLPNNISIQGVGIEPDFLVERRFGPPEQLTWLIKHFGREESITNHIQQPNGEKKHAEKMNGKIKKEDGKKDKPKTIAEQTRKHLQEDNQLREALTFINLLDTARKSCPQNISNRTNAIQFIKANCAIHQPITLEQVTEQ